MLPFWKLGKTNMYHPLDFPISGSEWNIPHAGAWDTSASLTFEMLNIPTGNAGLVRRIQFIFESDEAMAAETIPLIYLNICYDGEVTPSVSVPIGSLAGYETTSTVVAGAFDTPLFLVNEPIINPGANNLCSIIFKYPIPYTNGIHIYLSTPSFSFNYYFWTDVLYQDSLPATWNRNYRFFAERSNQDLAAYTQGSGTISISVTTVTGSGTSFTGADVGKILSTGFYDALIVAVTDSTHLTIGSTDKLNGIQGMGSGIDYYIGEPHHWLTRPAGKNGYLVSTVGGFSYPSAYGGLFPWKYLEANPRIALNQGTTDNIVYTGGEDFFSCAFYSTTPQQNSLGGVVCKDTSLYSITMYALFADEPIKYTDGIDCKYANIHDVTLRLNWASVYYEEQ